MYKEIVPINALLGLKCWLKFASATLTAVGFYDCKY
jgi:hypothetical protein